MKASKGRGMVHFLLLFDLLNQDHNLSNLGPKIQERWIRHE